MTIPSHRRVLFTLAGCKTREEADARVAAFFDEYFADERRKAITIALMHEQDLDDVEGTIDGLLEMVAEQELEARRVMANCLDEICAASPTQH